MKNTYYLLRHGESLKNIKGFESSWPEKTIVPLTKKGIKEAKRVAKKAKNKKINLIFSSDLLRTKQTAEIIAKELGIKVKLDKRLREIGLGLFNGKSVKEYGSFWDKARILNPFQYYLKRYEISAPKGENYKDVEKRLKMFIKEIDGKYKGKNIIIVSHGRPLTLLEKIVNKHSFKKFVKIIMGKKEIKTGELRKLK
ncbi:MAG: histidine phosphatase family protein [Candidatus Nealsonbacteria bacterium]